MMDGRKIERVASRVIKADIEFPCPGHYFAIYQDVDHAENEDEIRSSLILFGIDREHKCMVYFQKSLLNSYDFLNPAGDKKCISNDCMRLGDGRELEEAIKYPLVDDGKLMVPQSMKYEIMQLNPMNACGVVFNGHTIPSEVEKFRRMLCYYKMVLQVTVDNMTYHIHLKDPYCYTKQECIDELKQLMGDKFDSEIQRAMMRHLWSDKPDGIRKV